jgi:hypothetical protein
MGPVIRPHFDWKKKAVARVARAGLRYVPRRWLLAAFLRLEQAWVGRGTSTLVSSCGSYGAREFYNAEWFSASKDVAFAGSTYPVPIGVDELMTLYYGDYMQPVPVDEQTTALRFATRYNVIPLREQGVIV